MKYFLPCFIAAIIPLCASASYNPMFGDNHKNSVSVHLGQGTGPGSLFKLVNPGQWDFMPQPMLLPKKPLSTSAIIPAGGYHSWGWEFRGMLFHFHGAAFILVVVWGHICVIPMTDMYPAAWYSAKSCL